LQIIAREIKVHSKLDHPHVIKLWDTLFDNNKIYMVMDYAKNGSLFKYQSTLLQGGTQPTISQVYQFFYQTLQAVKYLHTNDIMHRDIKVIYSLSSLKICCLMKISILNYVILDGPPTKLPLPEVHSVEHMNIWHLKWFFKKAMIIE
jgi:serine/threonine protein kinase